MVAFSFAQLTASGGWFDFHLPNLPRRFSWLHFHLPNLPRREDDLIFICPTYRVVFYE
jgi:hypothetical protein